MGDSFQADTGRSFMELTRIHDALAVLFADHQAKLVLMRGAEANRLFDSYRRLLALHIYHEDELLLPVFRRIGDIKRWPATLFSGEHRKLEGFLSRIDSALSRLGEPGEEKAALIVETIDIQGGLKRLMEHHDERERQCLFPILDQVTEAEERHTLLHQVFSEWLALKQALLET